VTPVETDVLVVGAGPTGATLACALARAGVRFRMIDAMTARSPYSRALVMHQRSLEIFHQLGIAERLRADGNPVAGARVHVGRRPKLEVDFPDGVSAGCRFGRAVFIEQGRTEAALDAALSALGHGPQLGHELLGFRELGDGIEASVRAPGGEYPVRCRYLVGCDGAHSAVRRGARIPFEGASYAQDFMLADLDLEWEQPKDRFMAFLDGDGFLALFPLRDQVRLVSARGTYREDAPEPTLADFRALVERLVPYPARVSRPTWMARFHLHHRIARRFRTGRVLLAGDAAHIHSPVGGQGMNTGIQDAWNLGWKLAWALRAPRAADLLLDSYHEERHPVGRTLLATTDAAFDFVAGQTLLPRAVRSAVLPWLLPLVESSERLLRIGAYRISQLGIHYRGSPLCGPDAGADGSGAGPRAGDRVPDVEVDGRSLHAQLDPLGPTLLCVGGAAPRTVPGRPIRLPDPTPEQRRLLGVAGSACLLIRPDAHLAARASRAGELSGAALLRSWEDGEGVSMPNPPRAG